MPMTVGQAAKITGFSKPTIARAIKAGRLSAQRKEDGSYEIDPAELARVYAISVDAVVTGNASGNMTRPVPGIRSAVAGGHEARHDAENVPVTVARLEGEIESLKAQLAMMRDHAAELRQQRDAWQGQAEVSQRLLADQRPQRRSWFGRGREV